MVDVTNSEFHIIIAKTQDGCNAFAKELKNFFNWLVRIINCVASIEYNYKDNVDVDHYGNID